MGDILIRNVPEALKISIERQAKATGISLSEQVKRMLELVDQHDKPEKSLGALLQEAFQEQGVSEEEDKLYQQIMSEIEADRKQDFGRPLPYADEE